MRLDGVLKALTLLIVVATVGFVAIEAGFLEIPAIKEKLGAIGPSEAAEQASLNEGTLKEGTLNDASDDDTSDRDATSPKEPDVQPDMKVEEEVTAGGRLFAGVLGEVADVAQIKSLKEVPWLESKVNAAFNASGDFVCKLLPPDTPVKSPLVRQSTGRRGTLGRVPILTVGLEVEEESRNKLPAASKSAVERYMRDHLLAIEPIIYQAEDGSFYFGTDSRAAFFATSNPSVCIRPEPMIEQAVNNFRALGILDEDETGLGRTLVMAFRYVQSRKDQTSLTLKPRAVTELLFLHMKPSQPGSMPVLEVFATNDERKDLYLLATSLNVIEDALPTISASVRFEKFVLLGLYPAQPIVTGIRQRSVGVLSLDTIMRLTTTGDPEDRLSFTDVLDQFSTLTSAK